MLNESKQRSEKNIWSERDLEDVSDSGVMSLPTSEDFTSDSELSDTVMAPIFQKYKLCYPHSKFSSLRTPTNILKKIIYKNFENVLFIFL